MIILTITEEDAKNQKGYFCHDCLLGTAIKRLYPETKNLRVGTRYVNIDGTEYWIEDHGKIYGFYYIPMSKQPPFTVTLIPE